MAHYWCWLLRTVVRFDQFLSVLVTNVDLEHMVSKLWHWIICHIKKTKAISDCGHNKEICYKSTKCNSFELYGEYEAPSSDFVPAASCWFSISFCLENLVMRWRSDAACFFLFHKVIKSFCSGLIMRCKVVEILSQLIMPCSTFVTADLWNKVDEMCPCILPFVLLHL